MFFKEIRWWKVLLNRPFLTYESELIRPHCIILTIGLKAQSHSPLRVEVAEFRASNVLKNIYLSILGDTEPPFRAINTVSVAFKCFNAFESQNLAFPSINQCWSRAEIPPRKTQFATWPINKLSRQLDSLLFLSHAAPVVSEEGGPWMIERTWWGGQTSRYPFGANLLFAKDARARVFAKSSQRGEGGHWSARREDKLAGEGGRKG